MAWAALPLAHSNVYAAKDARRALSSPRRGGGSRGERTTPTQATFSVVVGRLGRSRGLGGGERRLGESFVSAPRAANATGCVPIV